MSFVRNLKRPTMILLAPLLALGVICNFGEQAFGQSFTIEPGSINFGVIGHMEKKTTEFVVTNKSDSPISFTKVKTSCDCMNLKFDKKTPIPAGESRKAVLTVSFGRGYSKFHKNIQFETADYKYKLNVNATHHPTIKLNRIDREFKLFGVVGQKKATHVRPGEQKNAIVIQGIDSPPVITELEVIRGLARSQGQKHAHIQAFAGKAVGNSVAIAVKLLEGYPEGRVMGAVRAKVNGLNFVIPIQGQVYKGIIFNPGSINFSRIQNPTEAAAKMQLVSADGKAFKIKNIQIKAFPRKTSTPIKIVQVPMNTDGKSFGIELVATLADPEAPDGSTLGGKILLETTHPDCPKLEVRYLGFIRRNNK